MFDENVTMKKVQGYRSQMDDESSGDRTSGTYAEMVEEVEKVSDMLMQTQSKLWQSQDELKSYNSKAKILQSSLDQKEHEIKRLRQQNEKLREDDENLRHEIGRLNQEICDRDEGRARPELERRLRKAIDFLKKDLEDSNEKHAKVQEEIQSQRKEIAELRVSNKSLEACSQKRENKAVSSHQQLSTCQKQLREATEGNAYLVEEVAKLREELSRTKNVANQKDVLIRREVEDKVKEKIKLEVTKSVTKQVTDRVTREVTSKMKAERETELKALRDQIRNIVKENSTLKSKIDAAENMAAEADSLQKDVESLTYELRRYESMITEAKQEHEKRVSELETDYRIKLQSSKEQAAKEKWAHGSEIRKQMAAEREREVENLTERIEALSKQTDRLLSQAEQEKEAHGALVKKRTEEKMQCEIKTLSEKLSLKTKESDQLLENAKKDKQVYAEQVKRAAENEKRREISKFSYQIEVLHGEKDSLEKRIESSDEELSSLWQENERYVEQLKSAQADKKTFEDDNYKLRRKIQNLSTLVNRYKQDAEDASSELKNSKQLFREALLKSEEQSSNLKAKLKKFEPMMGKSKEHYEGTLQALEDARETLIARMKLYENENAELKAKMEGLQKELDARANQNWNESRSENWCGAIKKENDRLKDQIVSFESLLCDVKSNESSRKDGILLAMEVENANLKSRIEDIDNILRNYKAKFQRSSTTSKHEIEGLKEQLQNTNLLLDEYRSHRDDATQALIRARQTTEDALTVASEDDTVQLNQEIEAIERMLEMFRTNDFDTLGPTETDLFSAGAKRSDKTEVKRLRSEVDSLTALLDAAQGSQDNAGCDQESQIEALHVELDNLYAKKVELEKKIKDQSFVIEKYRFELSHASQDLEHTRQTLASEGETAEQLSRRVESLNLLLDTTEQNHAENSRELARTHRRLDEAAKASKRETEELNIEIKTLRSSLSQSEFDLTHLRQQADKERQKYEDRLHVRSNEILGLKEKLTEAERKLCNQQKVLIDKAEEFEHSQRRHNDLLNKSEEEIARLNQQVDDLTQANSGCVEESKTLQSAKAALETALYDAHKEREDAIKKLEDLLLRSREESKSLVGRMEDSEKKYRAALTKSEDERMELQKSLDDVKRTLLGQTSDESSLDNSLRRAEGQLGVDEIMAPIQEALNTLQNDSDDGTVDSPSFKIISRIDGMLGSKKKQITWKESDWDIDASTVTTRSRHQQEASLLDAYEAASTNGKNAVDLRKHNPVSNLQGVKGDCSTDGALAKEPENVVVETYEETVRHDRKWLMSSVKGTSWDASTINPARASSLSEDVAAKTHFLRARQSNARTSGWKRTDGKKAHTKVKKGVSWDLDDLPHIGKSVSHNYESTVQAREDTVVQRNDESTREPAIDTKKKVIQPSQEEHREDAADDHRERSTEANSNKMFDDRAKNPDLQDDESSTIDWNISQPDDLESAERFSASDSSEHHRNKWRQKNFTSREESLDPENVSPVEDGLIQQNSQNDDLDPFDTSHLYPPSTIGQNLQLESFSSSSFSSSFSYSSNGSSSDNENGDDHQETDTILAVASDAIPIPEDESVDHAIPLSLPEQRRKSRLRRMRDKSSRRNWTRGDLNQFLSGRRYRHSDTKPSFHLEDDRPYDEAMPLEPTHAENESRDAEETVVSEAVTIDSTVQSNE